MKIHIHGFVNFSWFMKITSKEFHGNFMTQVNAMKSEIAVFVAIRSGFMFFFPTHFLGIFMRKGFILIQLLNEFSSCSFKLVS